MELDDILAGLEGIYGDVERVSGIRIQYARADRKSHQNSHTFYLGYEGPLPAVSAKEVKVDITIREQLVCAAEDRPVLRGYAEYEDLPEDARIRAYALNEIGVEKLVALTDRARNEPRNLYDLWFLTEEGHVDLGMLVPEIEQKLSFRGRTRETMTTDLEKKEARYKKLWSARLGSQMATLPLRGCLRAMRRELRAGEPDRALNGTSKGLLSSPHGRPRPRLSARSHPHVAAPRPHVPALTSGGFALVTHRIAHVCRVAAMRAAGGYPAFAENGGPA